MRTFPQHAAKHPLHGITVVVETAGPELWIGRCDDVVAEGVILKDADVHADAAGELPRAEWLERARRWGVHPRHRRTLVPAGVVVRIQRLAEI